MPIIMVASDIFGRTRALERLCRDLGPGTRLIDPYGGKQMAFGDEARAYACFTEQTGLTAYTDKVRTRVEACREPVMLVGFSAGATASWCLACGKAASNLTRAVCFYGSRIRDFTDLAPRVRVDCILPESEPGFSIPELADVLSQKEGVSLRTTAYAHGFMNPLSKGYDAGGYERYRGWLLEQSRDSPLEHKLKRSKGNRHDRLDRSRTL